MPEKALPYHEPTIETILIQASFVLALNLVGYLFDRLLYCGLVGQIFVGIAWGTPVASWLPLAFQKTVVQLGYLGLILLVFEGGLSTSIVALKSNLGLSVAVAATGVCIPIGLSFVLLTISDSTPFQAFAAGSALCSTSLGTTFTVLKTSGFVSSRLGFVLTSAAILDDVIGLVMVQVISNLGPSKSSITAVTVVRPIAVSFAFATILPVFCRFMVKPLAGRVHQHVSERPTLFLSRFLRAKGFGFLLYTFILAVLVTAASYAGTSNLFAAYLAGAAVSWYDKSAEVSAPAATSENSKRKRDKALDNQVQVSDQPEDDLSNNTLQGIELTLQASILETSVQANKMTDGRNAISPSLQVILTNKSEQARSDNSHEKGIIPYDVNSGAGKSFKSSVKVSNHLSGIDMYEEIYATPVKSMLIPFFFASIGFSIPISQLLHPSVLWRGVVYALLMTLGKLACGMWLVRFSEKLPQRSNSDMYTSKWGLSSLPKPKSLYPASILGCAMVARGEIGFLISAIAETNGIFTTSETGNSSQTSNVFLIVTWAILLCTVIGPVAVGLITRRVKRLQRCEREQKSGAEDPLGIWGII